MCYTLFLHFMLQKLSKMMKYVQPQAMFPVCPLQTRMGHMSYILFLHFMLQKLSKMM
jgi:hypothetical protein